MKRLLFVLALAVPALYGRHACSAMTTGAIVGTGSLVTFRPFSASSLYTNISASPDEAVATGAAVTLSWAVSNASAICLCVPGG